VQKGIRIAYPIIGQKVIVEVVAIGKRENMSVYQTSLKEIRPQS